MRVLARSVVLFAALSFAVSGCAAEAKTAASPEPRAVQSDVATLTLAGSRLALRRSAVADQYFWLRVKALEGDAPPEHRAAFDAMRELRDALSSDSTAWEDLEVPLGSAMRTADLVRDYSLLPDRVDVAGRPVALRELAVRLARAMTDSEVAYRRGPYRAHADAVARAATDLGRTFIPRVGAILDAVETEMALPGLERELVITLVGDAPYPAIFAADDRGRVMASFVRVRGTSGSELVELVLHECLHAIDEMTVRSPTAMNSLRHSLSRRGIDESDPNVEMAINTVTFAEAGSLVRRFVDPSHRPLGESGFYTLYPPAPAIVAAWHRHLDGEELDATADAIARAVAEP